MREQGNVVDFKEFGQSELLSSFSSAGQSPSPDLEMAKGCERQPFLERSKLGVLKGAAGHEAKPKKLEMDFTVCLAFRKQTRKYE